MILVTGGSGFLGGAIVRRLRVRGDAVRCIQRHDSPALRALGVDVVCADLAERDAVIRAAEGCTAVFHVAAKTGVWGRYEDFYQPNVLGTRNVLAACAVHGIRQLVFTSTPSVIHAGGDIEGIDESVPIASHFETAYPATKAEAEQLVLAANGPALATVALRPHLIWGPDDPQLTARVLARGKAGRLRLVGKGEKLIDSVYIDNAVDAHLLALERLTPAPGSTSACAGKAYFITQGEPMPQRELINGILKAGGLPPCTRSISPGAAYLVGGVMELAWRLLGRQDEPLMTRFLSRQLATAHWYDISAAKRDLSYTPKVSVADGLQRLAQSLRQAVPRT